MNYPEGLALDAKGDVFISDTDNSKVFELTRSVAPSLSFAPTNVGATSSDSPQSVQLENIGNIALKVTAVTYPTDYSQGTASSPCFPGGIAPRGTCSVAVNFTPKSGGALSESLTVSDNALNLSPAVQTVTLTRTGIDKSQTITFGTLPNVTLGVAPISLTASASSGLPVSYSVIGLATLNGSQLTITGGGKVAVTASQAGNASFAPATSVTQSFTVSKATAKVTLVASPNPATAGVPVALIATVTGEAGLGVPTGTVNFYVDGVSFGRVSVINGVATIDDTLSAASHVVGSQYNGDAHYSGGDSSLVPVIAKNTQTISFNQPASPVSYGVAPIALSATGGLSGNAVTFTVTSGPGTVSGNLLTIHGAGIVVVAANQLGNGTYFSATTVSHSITVNKALLTVTANGLSKVYGAALPTLTDTITGFVHGDTAATAVTGVAALTTTATAKSAVGAYPITAATGTLVAAYYSFKFVAGTLTVSKAVLTVTAANLSKVYGAALPTLTDTITGYVNGDTAATAVTGMAALTTTATAKSVAGSYPITPTVGMLVAKSYSFKFVAGTLTVSKAVLTVTAANLGKVYGAALPTLTDTITGYVNGDTAATAVTGMAALTTTATAKSTVGNYAIAPTVGTLVARNYTFKFVAGTLTVAKAVLTVTATNTSVVFNVALPKLAFTTAGFVNGDASTVVTGAPVETTTAKLGSAPGTYPITITQGTLAAANYSFAFKNGTLTITPLGTVATPTFTPVAGTYASAQSVIIKDATAGAVIYYTTNGTAPTTTSTKYVGAIAVKATESIKAIAVVLGYTNSAVATAAYTIN